MNLSPKTSKIYCHMRLSHFDRISSSTEASRLSQSTENYLLAIYSLWEEDLFPTVTQLAQSLKDLPESEGIGTSLPSVTAMVGRIQKQDLISFSDDKKILLTDSGFNEAEDIVRRHRLAECLVVGILNMDLTDAHQEAHRLEHGMSLAFQHHLAQTLDYPTRSPFGRAIPGSGEPILPIGAIDLTQSNIGQPYRVIRIPQEAKDLVKYLADSELIPGEEVVTIESAETISVLRVATRSAEVSMGFDVAKQIIVSPST
jgi:DtxR family Mn-dependent transcriptional regulator